MLTRQDIQKTVEKIVQQASSPARVVVFGSYGRGVLITGHLRGGFGCGQRRFKAYLEKLAQRPLVVPGGAKHTSS